MVMKFSCTGDQIHAALACNYSNWENIIYVLIIPIHTCFDRISSAVTISERQN